MKKKQRGKHRSVHTRRADTKFIVCHARRLSIFPSLQRDYRHVREYIVRVAKVFLSIIANQIGLLMSQVFFRETFPFLSFLPIPSQSLK